MPFIVYLFVLLIAAGSVVFGLDWLTSPLPQMPKPSHGAPSSAVASVPLGTRTFVAPGAQEKGDATLSPVYPASPKTPAALAVANASDAPASPLCDINACAGAYRSFRASDCTYQPNNGPRRLCRKGVLPKPERGATAAAPPEAQATDARAQASCNVSVCARAYQSFDASDCTYQPYAGQRRLCTK